MAADDDPCRLAEGGLSRQATRWNRDEMAQEKEQRSWRLEKDMYFPSDCDVAAAVRLKCISANSCAIRGERDALLMGCHDGTK